MVRPPSQSISARGGGPRLHHSLSRPFPKNLAYPPPPQTQALMRTHWLPALGMSAFWQNVLYSAVAAGLAAVLTTPFDVLDWPLPQPLSVVPPQQPFLGV